MLYTSTLADGIDIGGITKTIGGLLPDNLQKSGQDIINDIKAPFEEAVREVGGEKVLDSISREAQAAIERTRSQQGLPPTNPEAGTATGGQRSPSTSPASTPITARGILAKAATPWGLGSGAVGAGATFIASGRGKAKRSMGKRIGLSLGVGILAALAGGALAPQQR
jgi:hypothetical protein